jgi:hypothetical protein
MKARENVKRNGRGLDREVEHDQVGRGSHEVHSEKRGEQQQIRLAAMTDLFIVHKEQGCRRSREHEEHLEEESEPVETDHAAKGGCRLTGQPKEKTDDHCRQQTAGCEPAHVAAFFLLPKRFHHEDDDGDQEDKDFREDGCNHCWRIH